MVLGLQIPIYPKQEIFSLFCSSEAAPGFTVSTVAGQHPPKHVMHHLCWLLKNKLELRVAGDAVGIMDFWEGF